MGKSLLIQVLEDLQEQVLVHCYVLLLTIKFTVEIQEILWEL